MNDTDMNREERDRLVILEQDDKYMRERVDNLTLQVSEMNGKLDSLIASVQNRTAFEKGAMWIAGLVGGLVGILISSAKTIISFLGLS